MGVYFLRTDRSASNSSLNRPKPSKVPHIPNCHPSQGFICKQAPPSDPADIRIDNWFGGGCSQAANYGSVI